MYTSLPGHWPSEGGLGVPPGGRGTFVRPPHQNRRRREVRPESWQAVLKRTRVKANSALNNPGPVPLTGPG